MATATIRGNLKTFLETAFASFSPQIIFTPSGVAVRGSLIMATKPIVVTPDTSGEFTVELTVTDTVMPDTWYTIAIEWLDPNYFRPEDGMNRVDFPQFKLRVPAGGGLLGDLLDMGGSGSPLMWWVDTVAPPFTARNLMWFNPATNDVKRWE